MISCQTKQISDHTRHYQPGDFLDSLLHSGGQGMDSILNHPEQYQVQIIYTRIDRDAGNRPRFTDFRAGVDPSRYFYPASSLKLPIALVALEKLNRIGIRGLDMNTLMLTDSIYPGTPAVQADTTAETGLPSIAQYLKRIFLISDNEAANRLYEFVGPGALNDRLHAMGYRDAEILHRFEVSLNEDENRHTNPIRFYQGGTLIYQQPELYNREPYPQRQDSLGRAWLDKGDSVVNRPMDFSRKNRISLEDLHRILQSSIFPESVPDSSRFDLTESQYKFLYQYMSEYPSQTGFPRYDTKVYYKAFVKFFWWGGKDSLPETIRIFNKPGWAYGYMIDNAYIVDFENHVEFLLSAVIYVNKGGITGSDKYEYEQTGRPFFGRLARLIYEYERQRPKKYLPDLSRYVVKYDMHN